MPMGAGRAIAAETKWHTDRGQGQAVARRQVDLAQNSIADPSPATYHAFLRVRACVRKRKHGQSSSACN